MKTRVCVVLAIKNATKFIMYMIVFPALPPPAPHGGWPDVRGVSDPPLAAVPAVPH